MRHGCPVGIESRAREAGGRGEIREAADKILLVNALPAICGRVCPKDPVRGEVRPRQEGRAPVDREPGAVRGRLQAVCTARAVAAAGDRRPAARLRSSARGPRAHLRGELINRGPRGPRLSKRSTRRARASCTASRNSACRRPSSRRSEPPRGAGRQDRHERRGRQARHDRRNPPGVRRGVRRRGGGCADVPRRPRRGPPGRLQRQRVPDADEPDAGLRRQHADTPILRSKRVAVVGGGNVAMDPARTALRLGADEVFIIYRRSRRSCPPAPPRSITRSRRGYSSNLLCNPNPHPRQRQGWVTASRSSVKELGEPDASGQPGGRSPSSERVRNRCGYGGVAIRNRPQPRRPAIRRPTMHTNKWALNVADEQTGRTKRRRLERGGKRYRAGGGLKHHPSCDRVQSTSRGPDARRTSTLPEDPGAAGVAGADGGGGDAKK